MKNGNKVGFIGDSMGGEKIDQHMSKVMVNLNHDLEELCKLYKYFSETQKGGLNSLETTIPEMKKTIQEMENYLKNNVSEK